MRKRPTRLSRFAAVDNNAIDAMESLLAVGVLTRLIRAKDGDDVTVESMARDYAEGESAIGKAMRLLVLRALVVKFKIQRIVSEWVVEGDKEVLKRGGTWWTTFSVDSIPFTLDDVAAMLAEIEAGGNARKIRIEPEHLDPRKPPEERAALLAATASVLTKNPPRPAQARPTPARPTPQNAGVGPTCGNADFEGSDDDLNPDFPHPRPTPHFPGVGRPGAGRPRAGQAGALLKTVDLENSLSPSLSQDPAEEREKDAAPEHHQAEASPSVSAREPGRSPDPAAGPLEHADIPPQRTTGADAPPTLPAAAGVDAGHDVGSEAARAWVEARERNGLGAPSLARRKRIATTAVALVADGELVEHVIAAAADMAREASWSDLRRHMEHWEPQTSAPGASGPQGADVALRDACGLCDHHGWRLGADGEPEEPMRRCAHRAVAIA